MTFTYTARTIPPARDQNQQRHANPARGGHMNLLLAFAPFILFVAVEHLVGIQAGLIAGAAAAAVLLARDLLKPGRSVKLLEIGTFLLFGGLSLLVPTIGGDWSIAGVRLRVDAGLLLIVLLSMVFGRPFSLQYARESVDRQQWDSPEFVRTNYVISAAWAVAFGVLVLADVVMDFMPGLPTAGSVLATVLALVAAAWFTGWYPQHHQVARRT
jgi:Na+/H+ antiporter NhaD/arsenite permease-like protein